MHAGVGGYTVDLLLTQGAAQAHTDAARRFIAAEIQTQQQQTQLDNRQSQQQTSAARIPHLKMNISVYKGGETESLPRWFVELETAIFARQITDTQLQVVFAMSNLGGRAKSWAFGKRMADPNCFPTFDLFKSEIEDAFQPPKCDLGKEQDFLLLDKAKGTCTITCKKRDTW